MERIGLRELRQHTSRYVDRAAAGEPIEISVRDRLVATASKPPRSCDGCAPRNGECRYDTRLAEAEDALGIPVATP